MENAILLGVSGLVSYFLKFKPHSKIIEKLIIDYAWKKGTMGLEVNDTIKENQGSLYRYSHKVEPKKILTPVTVSNGLAWNKDKDTMYYIDSPTKQIVSFSYDNDSGDISE